MQTRLVTLALVCALLVTGCAARPAPVVLPAPVPTAPVQTDPLPPAPADTTPPVPATGGVAQSNEALDQSLQRFFQDYYAARTRGDRAAVTAMTGDAYQARALSTLAADKGVAFGVEQVQWWNHADDRTTDPTPTVIRTRGQLKMGIPFRVHANGESWRIVDLLDPATGRWLSEPTPRTAPFPADLQASLDRDVRAFYQARSLRNGVTAEELYRRASGVYTGYLINITRSESRTLTQNTFAVQSMQVLRWAPGDAAGSGKADVQITRTVTAVDKQGRQTVTTGDSQLRLELVPDAGNGRPGWRVVDGFLTAEHAWVSGMAWSGLLVAA